MNVGEFSDNGDCASVASVSLGSLSISIGETGVTTISISSFWLSSSLLGSLSCCITKESSPRIMPGWGINFDALRVEESRSEGSGVARVKSS